MSLQRQVTCQPAALLATDTNPYVRLPNVFRAITEARDMSLPAAFLVPQYSSSQQAIIVEGPRYWSPPRWSR